MLENFHHSDRRVQNIRVGKFLSTALPSTNRASMGRNEESGHGFERCNNENEGSKGEETSTTDRGVEKLSDIFNIDLEKAEQQYVRDKFSSSAPTSKAAVRAAPRAHGRRTRNNTPGMIPTSEGGGKRS